MVIKVKILFQGLAQLPQLNNDNLFNIKIENAEGINYNFSSLLIFPVFPIYDYEIGSQSSCI